MTKCKFLSARFLTSGRVGHVVIQQITAGPNMDLRLYKLPYELLR